jgi:hypothetical protein
MIRRLTVYVDEGLARTITADAKAKGQPLAVWFRRAATAQLAADKLDAAASESKRLVDNAVARKVAQRIGNGRSSIGGGRA